MSRTPKAAPSPSPTPPAVIRAAQLYDGRELCRRLRSRRHSWRQARRLGRRVTRFGSRDYITGVAQQPQTSVDTGAES